MKHFFLIATAIALIACSAGDNIPATPTSNDEGKSTRAWHLGAMATAANPHAADAAIEMLEKGGHAVDAAIAAHTVLGLVEPQSSGIGGGGFMLVFERTS